MVLRLVYGVRAADVLYPQAHEVSSWLHDTAEEVSMGLLRRDRRRLRGIEWGRGGASSAVDACGSVA